MHLRTLALVAALTSAFAAATPAAAATYTALRHFSGADGAQPFGGLAVDGQGRVYGSTNIGGKANFGTLFRWDGGFTTLHHFSGGADGGWPWGTLLADGEGNLYGTTRAGHNYGTVFRWDRERTPNLRTLKNFIDKATDGVQPFGGLARDADGTLYGSTFYGGDLSCGTPTLGCGTLFAISPTGTFRQLLRFNGANGYGPAGTLLRQGDRLWGATVYAGPAWAGSPFSIKFDGSGMSALNPAVGSSATYNFTSGMAADRSGNRWGVSLAGGAHGMGAIWRIDAAGAYSVVHSFSGGDGAYPAGAPAIDGSGVLYGTTQGIAAWANQGSGAGGLGTVWKFDPRTGVLTTLHRFSGADGQNPTAGVVRDATGTLYGTTPYGGTYGKGVMFRIAP